MGLKTQKWKIKSRVTGGPFKPFWLEWESKMGLKTQKWKIAKNARYGAPKFVVGKATQTLKV
jgi:hypothetical protein